MVKHIYFIYGLMLIALVNCAQGRESMDIVNITCTSSDESAVVFETCEFPKVRQTNLTSFAIRVNLLKAIHNITLHLVVSKLGSAKSAKLMEFKSDICSFMKNKRRNPLVKLVYSAFGFEKYSNMNHACPYEGLIYMQSPVFSDRMLKLIGIPNGKYLFSMKYLLNKETRVDVGVVFEKKEDN